jgi:hypothetical protein
MSALAAISRNDSVGYAGADTADRPAGKLGRIPPVPEQQILAVRFRSPEGSYRRAIGGGATVAAAIRSARESCPDHTTWTAVGWSDLYGD